MNEFGISAFQISSSNHERNYSYRILQMRNFSIDRVCGEYFLSGKSFTTLSGLIQAFINESKTAVLPLQPPSVRLVVYLFGINSVFTLPERRREAAQIIGRKKTTIC